MYEIDEKDRVLALDGIPTPDAGAPMPLVAANEHRLIVAYYLPNAWEPSMKGQGIVGDETATVSFDILSFMFGYPNEEAIYGHPLYERGLSPIGAWEVIGSSWVRKLERINRVHDRHDPEVFLNHRHFILTFHDTMLECIARDFKFGQREEMPSDAMRRNMEWLFGGQ